MNATAISTSRDGSVTYHHALKILRGSETKEGVGYQREVVTTMTGGNFDGRTFKTYGKVYKTLRGAENDSKFWMSYQDCKFSVQP